MGFRVWGLGFRVEGVGFRLQEGVREDGRLRDQPAERKGGRQTPEREAHRHERAR